MSLRSSWFRPLFALALVGPALLCQEVVPLVPRTAWEALSEDVYAQLLALQTPRTTEPSPVLTVEVDKKTIDALGWPVDRAYYVRALERLRASGHPWVLSMLSFQALSKAKLSNVPLADRYAMDQSLADAIKAYGRVVGTGLRIQPGVELDADLEDHFMPRVTLARNGRAPADLPRLPLTFVEDPAFVDGQRAFGFGTLFGPEPVVRCMQMYLTDKAQAGLFVIPSALVWAAALANGSGLHTATGAGWPRTGEGAGPTPLRGVLAVSFKECLTSPAVTTLHFLKVRGIQRISLVDLLETAALPALADKVVVLADAETNRYLAGPGRPTPVDDGPGSAGGAPRTDDGAVQEHLLAARFLDGLLTGDIIQRDERGSDPVLDWLPLAGAAALLLCSLWLPLGGVIGSAFAALLLVLLASAGKLLAGVYVLPIQTMAALAGNVVGLTALYAYLRYDSVQRQMRFATGLRTALSQCNTLAEIERLALGLCAREFAGCTVEFTGFDRARYDASTDTNAALQLLDARVDGPGGGAAPQSLLRRTAPAAGIGRLVRRQRGMAADLAIDSRLGHLGRVLLDFTYPPHEEPQVAALLDVFQVELAQHWHRIKMLADQRLLDFRYLREHTRGEIMGRFLTKALVAKFSDSRTMEENLQLVLTPRPTTAALLQADIRGYSKISERMRPEEMVRLLQSYYRHVVDAAQMVAQVKLIGDCIFLFVEAEAGTALVSPADIALELAALLVAETERRNAQLRAETGEGGLNFGIAIHYGDVVVGNLSSDSCIDYTVIGQNVNLVARLEELTKNKRVSDVIGPNGVVISSAAAAALVRHRAVVLTELRLDQLGIAVRSFAEVTTVSGMTSEAAMALRPSTPASTPEVSPRAPPTLRPAQAA